MQCFYFCHWSTVNHLKWSHLICNGFAFLERLIWCHLVLTIEHSTDHPASAPPIQPLIHSAFLAHFWALHLLISLPDVKSASHLFGLWRKEGVLRKNTTAEHAIGRETDHGVLVPIQVDNQARCSKGTYCRANSQLELRYHLKSPPKVTIADSLDSEMHTY